MSLSFFLRGLLIGLMVAAPVGPIGVLCIRRTLADGRLTGFVTGLGAAVADAMYGAVAAFGLTAVSQLMLGGRVWMRAVGGAFLLYLGVRTALARPKSTEEQKHPGTLVAAFATTVLLTLANPATILSFAAIFAGFGLLDAQPTHTNAGLMVAGVFLGSAAWWLFLSGLVGLRRRRFDERAMVWVNRGSGALIGGFGVAAIVSALV